MTGHRIAGCGWTPELAELTGPEPLTTNDIPCAARSGYKPAHLTDEDDWTTGRVGLCRSCLEQPADLLRSLSLEVSDDRR